MPIEFATVGKLNMYSAEIDCCSIWYKIYVFHVCVRVRTPAKNSLLVLSWDWRISLSLDSKQGKNSVVSSLDCLSSIVERISTESTACPALPTAESGIEGSPCSLHEGASLSDTGAQTSSPASCTQVPQDSANHSASNPIYQVLWSANMTNAFF